jgi:hypothetical protein
MKMLGGRGQGYATDGQEAQPVSINSNASGFSDIDDDVPF